MCEDTTALAPAPEPLKIVRVATLGPCGAVTLEQPCQNFRAGTIQPEHTSDQGPWVGQSSGRVCQGGRPRLRLLWPLLSELLTAVPTSSDVRGILNHSHAVIQTKRCLRTRCTPSLMLLSGCWPHVERLTAANLARVAAPAAAALTGVVIGLHGRFRSTSGTAVANGIAMVFICTQLDRKLPSNSINVCFVPLNIAPLRSLRMSCVTCSFRAHPVLCASTIEHSQLRLHKVQLCTHVRSVSPKLTTWLDLGSWG